MKWIVNAVVVCLLAGGGVAGAQPAPNAATLEARIAMLQQQLDALRAQVEALRQTADASPATPTAPAGAPTAPAAGQVASAIQRRDVLTQNPAAAARIDNVPMDPERKGFIELPGTSTRIKFGGNAKLDVIHDFRPAGESDSFVTSTIPIGDVPAADDTSLSARQSRLSTDLRQPTRIGELRVFYENDFYDLTTGETQFNLRHFYGQVANVLGGFTYSTLMDADSMPDTLDYGGPGSMIFMLQPVLRYTVGLDTKKQHTLAFAIEKGQSDIVVAVAGDPVVITPTSPAPDFHTRYRFDGETGHMQLGAVMLSVDGYASTGEAFHVFGGGMSLSGSKRVFGGDYLLFQGSYGKGMGRYMQDVTGLAPDVGLDQGGRVVANASAGYYLAYQHYWNRALRSTATYGFAWVDSKDKTFTTTFNQSEYAAVNAIWSLRDTPFNIGIEYLWGRQQLKSGESGDANRLQFSIQYDIVR